MAQAVLKAGCIAFQCFSLLNQRAQDRLNDVQIVVGTVVPVFVRAIADDIIQMSKAVKTVQSRYALQGSLKIPAVGLFFGSAGIIGPVIKIEK